MGNGAFQLLPLTCIRVLWLKLTLKSLIKEGLRESRGFDARMLTDQDRYGNGNGISCQKSYFPFRERSRLIWRSSHRNRIGSVRIQPSLQGRDRERIGLELSSSGLRTHVNPRPVSDNCRCSLAGVALRQESVSYSSLGTVCHYCRFSYPYLGSQASKVMPLNVGCYAEVQQVGNNW